MKSINIIRDASFLRQLDKENLKTYYVKILVLNKEELPLTAIEGRVTDGNISVDGNSNMRRTGSITFIAEEEKNDLTDINNLLSLNKKIKILIGLENTIDSRYEDIIWFNQGIFVITQPSITNSFNGVIINLNFKDKMCLLNGECGGGLPTSVTFDSYDQYIGSRGSKNEPLSALPDEPNNYTVYYYNNKYWMYDEASGWTNSNGYENLIGTTSNVKQLFYDIILTAVCNFGGESIENIIINDVPFETKQLVRNTSSKTIYYNNENDLYSFKETGDNVRPFGYNQDIGYVFTEFVYPGELVTGIGDNVCSVLDALIEQLGNYEYFYDIEGHFVFQEKKNYLNNTYEPIQKLNEQGFILDEENCYMDINNTSESIYTFEEDTTLISSYTNNPNYLNIKNDFHIWGETSAGQPLHYHLVIKEKPIMEYFNEEGIDDGPRLRYPARQVVAEKDKYNEYTGRIRLFTSNDTEEEMINYIPTDWRAELYLQGLEAQSRQQRPDIYQQELLDLFDIIYDMRLKEYKEDINKPNGLLYFIDYIEPSDSFFDISVDSIGPRVYSHQQEKIRRIYDDDVPDIIILGIEQDPLKRDTIIKKCAAVGQPYSNLDSNVFDNVTIGTIGYTAHEVARDLLYRYTNYNETISISSIPIYYLEPNYRISVFDLASGIKGDYIINSFNVSLANGGLMNISASKAIERI